MQAAKEELRSVRYNEHNIAKTALVECVFDHAKGATTAVDYFPGTELRIRAGT
jgi:hypothetical protein